MRILRPIRIFIRSLYNRNRTRAAGLGLLALSSYYGLPYVDMWYPNLIPIQITQRLPEGDWERSLWYLIGALFVWGIGGKLTKILDSIESSKNMF